MSSNAVLTAPTKSLSPEQLAQYREQGFLIVRGLLGPEEVDRVQRLKQRIEGEVAGADGDFQRDGADYNFERVDLNLENVNSTGQIRHGVLRKIQDIHGSESEFRAACVTENVLDIVEDIIGPEIYYHSSKLMFKPARGGRQKPWHQDFAYWSEQNPNQVTVWYAIDPATRENGCVKTSVGSHKRGLRPHFGKELQLDPTLIPAESIVYAEMQPGDVLFFDVLTLHGSDPNFSEHPRLSCIVDFQCEPTPLRKDAPDWLRQPLRSAGGV